MNVTFVVTTYNVLPYIDACLASIADCLRGGDTVLIVDDGSTDGTATHLDRIAREAPLAGRVKLILLGTNSFGGVGIPANIGMAQALEDPACDALFFVDGDDWLDPAGFAAARAHAEVLRPDLLCANYLLFDEGTGSSSRPADPGAWRKIHTLQPGQIEEERAAAIELISVPWRKFYRADFLRQHRPRFPEGDFFYEDNPFHWEVCLRAKSFAFVDRALCFHRINRPGLTMAETGVRLLAFFDHFDTILRSLGAQRRDPWEHPLANTAVVWLLTNMTWHLERLHSSACRPYAARAAQSLAAIPEAIWTAAAARFNAGNPVGLIGSALRSKGPDALAAHWELRAFTSEIQSAISPLQQSLQGQGRQLENLETNIRSLREIARFQALRDLTRP